VPYRSPLEETPENLKRTILGTFDFRGRSTRTELFTFMFISQFAAGIVGLILIGPASGADFETPDRIRLAVRLLFGLPFIALLVRRLHDQDRTGWWALLLVAGLVLMVVKESWMRGGPGIVFRPTPWWLDAAMLVLIVGLWIFSLWPPSDETNRFGPNPRFDEEPAADQ
jgi:uncharacterized membrane protein YhaH (DUF805 family)